MFNVLSYDSKKIKMALSADGKLVVRKKTVEKEYRNILLAQSHMLKHRPVLTTKTHGTIQVMVAEIVEWNDIDKYLSTLYCVGKNIEELLRESIGSTRDEIIGLLRQLLEAFQSNGFLWGDFCPRNMIWNQERGIIWLVDFERELRLKDCPIDQCLFNRYVRGYSREEFSSFLTSHEGDSLFDGFLNENGSEIVPIDHIKSKRKRALLVCLCGEKKYYSLDEVRSAEDLMSAIATPFFVNGEYFFPMDSLDLIGSRGGSNEYVKTVIAIRGLEENDRFSELKKRTEAL